MTKKENLVSLATEITKKLAFTGKRPNVDVSSPLWKELKKNLSDEEIKFLEHQTPKDDEIMADEPAAGPAAAPEQTMDELKAMLAEKDAMVKKLEAQLAELKGKLEESSVANVDELDKLKEENAKFQAMVKDKEWEEMKTMTPLGMIEGEEKEAEARKEWEENSTAFTIKVLKFQASRPDLSSSHQSGSTNPGDPGSAPSTGLTAGSWNAATGKWES